MFSSKKIYDALESSKYASQRRGGNNVVTQQTINNRPYNYSPNYSVFPEVIRDTLVSRDLGAKVVTFAYVN
jgi:hypothetical protein